MRRFKVVVTETTIEDEKQKVWRQIRQPESSRLLGKENDYGYVEEVLPSEKTRTVVEAELETLDIPRLVMAVFGLEQRPVFIEGRPG